MFNLSFPHSLARTEMYIFVSYAIHNEQGRYVPKLHTWLSFTRSLTYVLYNTLCMYAAMGQG